MSTVSTPVVPLFWRDAATPRRRRAALPFLALLALAASAAFITAAILPPAKFRAQATIAVANPASPWAAMLYRAAADQAVSKAVIERAATSLNETGFVVSEPALFERLELAFGVGGVRATGRAARLAAELGDLVSVQPGVVPGGLDLVVSSTEPERSALAANALAEALIANEADVAARSLRTRDRAASARLEDLKSKAAAARRRLAALGGSDAEPAQARGLAAAQIAAAQSRLDAIRVVVASGNPPLGDRRDMPPSIEALQTSYLDLSRQLAKARETLGDRHTTIISLRAEVQHAASALNSEWKRCARVAEQELALAKARAAALGKAAADAPHQDAISAARRDVELADAAIAQTQRGEASPADERGYRLIAPAAIPTSAVGLAAPLRWLLSAAAALAVCVLGLAFGRVRHPQDVVDRESDTAEAAVHAVTDHRPADAAKLRVAVNNGAKVSDPPRAPQTYADRSSTRAATPPGRMQDVRPATISRRLARTATELISRLDALAPKDGEVSTIVVAATEPGVHTAGAALALARAAADHGRRTLVIEASRKRPELAAAADLEADPLVMDLFGMLRVVLAAEGGDDQLFVAPDLARGNEIAANLVRSGDAAFFDDVAAEFDLLVIDGGSAADAADAGWGADALLRVGTFASRRDDSLFTACFGVSADALLGTIVDDALVANQARPIRVPMSVTRSAPLQARSALQSAAGATDRAGNARAGAAARRRAG